MRRGMSLQMTSERSRNKERLEASLTWLWELEHLRQRQESLVLGALSLGDTVPGCPAWGDLQPVRSAESGPSREQEDLTLRRQLSRLQGAPNGLMMVLQQQLSELRADACDHTDNDLDSPSSSGFYEQVDVQSPPRRSSSSPPSSCVRASSVDAYVLEWEPPRDPPPRTALPRSFSTPYPPLEGIAEGTEEEEDEEDGVVNGEAANGPEMGPTVEVDEGLSEEVEEGLVGEVDEGPTEEDIQQALRVEAYILGLLQRCSISAPATSSSDHWQDLHPYSPSYRAPPPNHSDWHQWGALDEGEEDGGDDSQEGYYMSHLEAQAQPTSLGCEDPESSLESYAGVEPCGSQRGYMEHHPAALDSPSSRYIHTCVSPPLSPEEPVEQDWATRPLEQEPPRPLPRMHQEEWWTPASRSRSEGSFPPQGWAVQSEPRYHTVGRGMGSHQVDEDYLSNHRLWSSSADLSQEEEDTAVRGEERTRPPCHTLPHACTQYTDPGPRGQGAGPSSAASRADGSDSSLSETCSPGTSSTSSDSDESGGLVWPQQLPPHLPTAASHNTPGAMVKVKASHALKRKIQRFRSSSLKVMTTV